MYMCACMKMAGIMANLHGRATMMGPLAHQVHGPEGPISE